MTKQAMQTNKNAEFHKANERNGYICSEKRTDTKSLRIKPKPYILRLFHGISHFTLVGLFGCPLFISNPIFLSVSL